MSVNNFTAVSAEQVLANRRAKERLEKLPFSQAQLDEAIFNYCEVHSVVSDDTAEFAQEMFADLNSSLTAEDFVLFLQGFANRARG